MCEGWAEDACDSGLTETAASREFFLGDSDQGMRTGEQSEHLRRGLGGDSHGCVAFVRQVMRVCTPEEIGFELPVLGHVVLRPTVLEDDGAWLQELRHSCEEARFECADSAAHFLVERESALHIVNAILGHEPVIAVGSLSRIERGILQGVLMALSARLGLSFVIRLHTQESWVPNSDSIVVEVSMGLRGVVGRAWVCASHAFLAKLFTTQAHRPGQAQTMATLELGRTWLSVSDVAAAREGDVVVFDGVAALPLAHPWPAHLRRGNLVLPVSLRDDGVVAAAASGGRARDLRSDTKSERRPARRSASLALAKADACAEVVAEIGRIQSATLALLLCGEPLDRGRVDTILLYRDGLSWAEGEILAVEGDFAVRITRKLAE